MADIRSSMLAGIAAIAVFLTLTITTSGFGEMAAWTGLVLLLFSIGRRQERDIHIPLDHETSDVGTASASEPPLHTRIVAWILDQANDTAVSQPPLQPLIRQWYWCGRCNSFSTQDHFHEPPDASGHQNDNNDGNSANGDSDDSSSDTSAASYYQDSDSDDSGFEDGESDPSGDGSFSDDNSPSDDSSSDDSSSDVSSSDVSSNNEDDELFDDEFFEVPKELDEDDVEPVTFRSGNSTPLHHGWFHVWDEGGNPLERTLTVSCGDGDYYTLLESEGMSVSDFLNSMPGPVKFAFMKQSSVIAKAPFATYREPLIDLEKDVSGKDALMTHSRETVRVSKVLVLSDMVLYEGLYLRLVKSKWFRWQKSRQWRQMRPRQPKRGRRQISRNSKVTLVQGDVRGHHVRRHVDGSYET